MDRPTARAMRKQHAEAHATAMAAQKRVYISGLKGHHPLRLGVAYHYRGHQIYAFPKGEPIEPIAFKTKYGANLVSTVEGGPRYDCFAAGLKEEASVGALRKSCAVFWEEMRGREEREKEEVRRALEEETCVDDEEGGMELKVVARKNSRADRELKKMVYETTLVPAQVLSRAASRVVSRDGSQVDLRTLDGRPSSADTTRERSMRFVQSSSTTGLASMVTVEEAVGLLNVPRAPRALHRSSSSETQDLSGKSVPAFAKKLHHLSSQPGSSTSLADLGTRHDRTSSGGMSLSTLPGLGHSSSLTGSRGSSPSLTSQNRDPGLHHSSTSLADLALRHDRHSSRGISLSALPGLGHSSVSHGSSPSLTSLNRERSQPATNAAPGMSSLLAIAHPHVWHPTVNTPHDRARFLSDSLPGSRLASVANTPYASRPVSPTHRPAASTSNLSHLLVPSADQGTATLFADMFGSATNLLADLAMSALPSFTRNKPISSDRPRRASMALNQAYNAGRLGGGGEEGVSERAPKCALHGEECDGVTVVELWKTERAQQTNGFLEVYPMLEGEGARVMVDWAHLLKEEQERLQN